MPDRQRILYVQPNNEVGGSDLALLRMVEALDQDYYQAFVALPGDGPMTERLRAAGATVRFVPMMQLRTLPSPSYQARYLARFWLSVWRLRRVIRQDRIDLVHTNSLYCLYAGFAARAARVRHLWHIREIPPAIPVARPALARMVLALSDMVVAMTQACAAGLDGARTQSPKMRFLSEGLDLARWSRSQVTRDLRQELGLPPSALLVGFVARLDPWKGLDVFLQAARLVASDIPNAVFLVSGDAPSGFEAYRDRMIALAAELDIADRVHFLGWRYRMDDIPILMAGLDVFCHTSIAPEPFGLVIIEAMAMGTPVIAADAGGPREMVVDGESGLRTPPGDAPALATAIRSLAADPDRRAGIAAAGRARVEAVYSLPAFQAQLGRLYEDVLAGVRT